MKYSIDERCFSFCEDDARVEVILKRLQSCLTSIQKESDIKYSKDLSDHTKLKLLDNLERILYGIRGSLEKDTMNAILEDYPISYSDIPVDIQVQKGYVKITTPLTTVRNMSSSYYIASEVLSKMKIYEQENDFSFYEFIDEPFLAIQKRKICKDTSHLKIKDNNNEDAHIINAITVHGFHRSDNISIMKAFVSTTEKAETFEEQGMDFIFVKISHLKEYADNKLTCKE